MKIRQHITYPFVAALLALASCAVKSSQPPTKNESGASPMSTTMGFVRDGKGNVIKPDGWEIPDLPPNRDYKNVVLDADGRKINALTFFFRPKEKMLVTIPKYWEDGDVTYKVTEIQELKGKAQAPYCYHFIVTNDWPDPENHPGVSTFFAYRDDDGDGIFETLSQGCAASAWVQ